MPITQSVNLVWTFKVIFIPGNDGWVWAYMDYCKWKSLTIRELTVPCFLGIGSTILWMQWYRQQLGEPNAAEKPKLQRFQWQKKFEWSGCLNRCLTQQFANTVPFYREACSIPAPVLKNGFSIFLPLPDIDFSRTIYVVMYVHNGC